MRLIILSFAALALLAGCAEKDEAGRGDAESAGHAPWKLTHNTNGEAVLAMDVETQERIKLETAPVQTAEWHPEIKGYGRVVDPAALAEAVADFDSARAAANASVQENERLQGLAAQNNASARAVQAAEAAAARDRGLAESARARLTRAWGRRLAERTDMVAFARSLVAGEAALVRIEVPAGEATDASPVSARLFLLPDEEHPVTAEFVDALPGVDPQSQGRQFLFLARSAGLPGGAAVTGYLELPGKPLDAVIVPRAAVLRHEGRAWVYLRTEPGAFTRREVSLDRATGNGWFVRAGLAAQDVVVTVGAQTLLSQELASSGFQSGDRD